MIPFEGEVYKEWDPPEISLIAYRRHNSIYLNPPDNYAAFLDNNELDYLARNVAEMRFGCSNCIHYLFGNCILKRWQTEPNSICHSFELPPPKPEQQYDMRMNRADKFEKQLIVLDDFKGSYISRKDGHRQEAHIVYFLGINHFSLLRIFFSLPPITIVMDREITISNIKDKILHIQRQRFFQLSNWSKDRLIEIIKSTVEQKEEDLVKIFNTARTAAAGLHQLKLLPGLSAQKRFQIIEERKNNRFDSFSNVDERIGINSVEIIAARILQEVQGNRDYYLFSVPLPKRDFHDKKR
jgi:putative nucleotide binding protein